MFYNNINKNLNLKNLSTITVTPDHNTPPQCWKLRLLFSNTSNSNANANANVNANANANDYPGAESLHLVY